MTTRKDVAQLAGVSVATVSYVVNGTKKVTPEVEQRVQKAVEALDYRPNLLARGLSTRKTRHVAMLVDNLQNPHYSELLSGAQSVASENGYIVSLISVDVSQPEDILDLTSRGVEGAILALGADYPLIYELLGPALPVAQVGRHIVCDFDGAMDDMLNHLTQLGHRRIGFLAGLPSDVSGHERTTAWSGALARHGLETSPELIVWGQIGFRMDPAEGEREMLELLDRGVSFTAVYAINDLMALGAMRALRSRGLRVPEDVSVVGNDRLEVLSAISPTLASLDMHAPEMGRRLMGQLIETITHRPHSQTRIVVDYVPGESVGPARSG